MVKKPTCMEKQWPLASKVTNSNTRSGVDCNGVMVLFPCQDYFTYLLFLISAIQKKMWRLDLQVHI